MKSIFVLFAFVVSIINATNGGGNCAGVIDNGLRNPCVLDQNGHVQCYGKDTYSLVASTPNDVVYSKIAVQSTHGCGIVAEDSSIKCWGLEDTNNGGYLEPDNGVYTDLCNYSQYNCAVKEDGYLYCWGKNGSNNYISLMPTDGDYKKVACGYQNVCALKTDGSIICWGKNGYDYEKVQTEIPEGLKLEAITLGTKHACGLKADKTIACWGHDDYDVYKNIPEGVEFDEIAASVFGFAAIKSDDKSMVCVGNDYKGHVTNCPEGEFRAVGCASANCCGVKTDDSISCWGREWDAGINFNDIMESGVKPMACTGGGSGCSTEEAKIVELEADVQTKQAKITELEGDVSTKQAKITELEVEVSAKEVEVQLWKSRFSEVEQLELDNRLSVAAKQKFPDSESEVGSNTETNSFANVFTFMIYISIVFGVFGVGNYLGKKSNRTAGYTEMSQM